MTVHVHVSSYTKHTNQKHQNNDNKNSNFV